MKDFIQAEMKSYPKVYIWDGEGKYLEFLVKVIN